MRIALTLAVASLGYQTPVWAQEAGADANVGSEPNTAAAGRIVYDQAYFAQYDVQNAQDMLRRVPGVSQILAATGATNQARGFGSGGDQILVNGRRFPGKSNDISKTLARLRADSVERVELIRGASSDIDVQSSGVVVNIVLKEGASLGGGGTFDLAARGNDEGRLNADGLVNYAGSTGSLGFNVGVERNLWTPESNPNARWTNRFRDEVYRNPDGPVRELRPQFWDREHNKWIFTGGLTYDFAGGARAQLNGLYETLKVVELNRINVVRFDQGLETGSEIEEQTRVNRIKTLELSGEFTASLGSGALTALFIGNRRKNPTLDERMEIIDDEVWEISSTLTDLTRTEYIGRVEYSFPLSSEVSVNVGGEGSNNKLKQDLTAAFDLDKDGQAEPIVVPTSNARVEEVRGEGFIDVKWNPSAALSANASLNYEHSKLTTNSVFNPGRTLGFLKPRLDVRYAISEAGQLRFLAEKLVSQLDFANFVPRYNVLDDRIDAGNPGLRPEQVWNLEVGYEHRFPDDLGVVEAMVYYRDVTDAIDFIPLQQGPVIVSAQGNLGHARDFGIEATASLRLDPMGLKGAVLTLEGVLEDTEVTDPFTGRPRRFRNDSKYDYIVRYRHDVTSINFSYGFDYNNRGTNRIQSDLFSRDLYRIGPLLSAFVEKRLTPKLVLRGEAQNLLGGKEYRKREIYAVNQMDGVVRRLDSFVEKRDIRYAIILKGSF